MPERMPGGIATMEARTDLALEQNRIERAIEARAGSPEVSLLNDSAALEIYGSGGRTFTDPESGVVIATPERPILGKLDDISKNPKYGKTQADRDASVEEYQSDVENLLNNGFELCQAKMVMDMRESDVEARATRTAKLIAGGLTAVEADNKAKAEYEKKDATRVRLIKEGGAFTPTDYEQVRKGEGLYPSTSDEGVEKPDASSAKRVNSVTKKPVAKAGEGASEKATTEPGKEKQEALDNYLASLEALRGISKASGKPEEIGRIKQSASDALYRLAETSDNWTPARLEQELRRIDKVHGFDLRRVESSQNDKSTPTSTTVPRVGTSVPISKTPEAGPKTPEQQMAELKVAFRDRLADMKEAGQKPADFFATPEGKQMVAKAKDLVDPGGIMNREELQSAMRGFITDALPKPEAVTPSSQESIRRKIGSKLVQLWRKAISQGAGDQQTGGVTDTPGVDSAEPPAYLADRNHRTVVAVGNGKANISLHKDLAEIRGSGAKEKVVPLEHSEKRLPPVDLGAFPKGKQVALHTQNNQLVTGYIDSVTSLPDGTKVARIAHDVGGEPKFTVSLSKLKEWQELAERVAKVENGELLEVK